MHAKPFLKWAGGKTQLIQEIETLLPQDLYNEPFTYIEPFVGGGSVLFWILETFNNLEAVIINDINTDLTDCYDTIQNIVRELIAILQEWQNEYHALLDNEQSKKTYYYDKRTLFNTRESDQTTQSALLIFLNRTCFNGLYRVNNKNEFNVPIGSYKKPLICNEENLKLVSAALKNVTILNGDYSDTLNYATNNTFFYFDPPYKPLSETSSFNAYAKDEFNDDEQIKLSQFCKQIDTLNYNWVLSNSDVKGYNPEDDFFDTLYADFEIARVNASRRINAKASKRGLIKELLIRNYTDEKANKNIKLSIG